MKLKWKKPTSGSIFGAFLCSMILLFVAGLFISLFSDRIGGKIDSAIQSFVEDSGVADNNVPATVPTLPTEIPVSDNAEDESIELYGPYSVVRVVDGDTIVVNIDGKETKIRMIGVDTPESVAPESYYKENSEEGILASDYTKTKLGDASIYLEYDVSKADKYDRCLAYVYYYTAEGVLKMYNEELLESGMGMLMTIAPNVKYADRFYDAQVTARNNKTGLWGSSSK